MPPPLVFVLLMAGAAADFQGYSVYRIVPTTENELSLLKSLANKEEYQSFLDFWRGPSRVAEPVDVMVSPQRATLAAQLMAPLRRQLLIQDVQSSIEQERRDMESPSFLSFRGSEPFFSTYRTLEELHAFVDELGARHPNFSSVFSIGDSAEGRPLKVIRVGGASTGGVVGKPSIWIDGGIHAREWVSPAAAAYIAHSLLSEYEYHNETRALLDHFDFYILPVLNPDGYVYSHTKNRMWRKSRRGPLIFCRGVDLNRNFDFHWREGGSSARPCSETYAGPSPFSEPESAAVSRFVGGRRESFSAFVTLHSYSQMWLTPWGWTDALPDNYADMFEVAKEAVQALSEVHGTKYRVGSSTNLLYVATGGSDDWALGSAGIPYSYTVELRDTGRHGFLLPAPQLLPTAEETWAGVRAMALAIRRKQSHPLH